LSSLAVGEGSANYLTVRYTTSARTRTSAPAGLDFNSIVIPAKAGISLLLTASYFWGIPAFAGMTTCFAYGGTHLTKQAHRATIMLQNEFLGENLEINEQHRPEAA